MSGGNGTASGGVWHRRAAERQAQGAEARRVVSRRSLPRTGRTAEKPGPARSGAEAQPRTGGAEAERRGARRRPERTQARPKLNKKTVL